MKPSGAQGIKRKRQRTAETSPPQPQGLAGGSSVFRNFLFPSEEAATRDKEEFEKISKHRHKKREDNLKFLDYDFHYEPSKHDRAIQESFFASSSQVSAFFFSFLPQVTIFWDQERHRSHNQWWSRTGEEALTLNPRVFFYDCCPRQMGLFPPEPRQKPKKEVTKTLSL